MLNYSIQEYEGLKIIELAGNITANTIESFKTFIESMADKESLMINLEKVNLITSSGVNILIDLSFFAKDHGKRIIFLWPSEDFQKLAETLDVYHYLIFAGSLEEGQTKVNYFT